MSSVSGGTASNGNFSLYVDNNSDTNTATLALLNAALATIGAAPTVLSSTAVVQPGNPVTVNGSAGPQTVAGLLLASTTTPGAVSVVNITSSVMAAGTILPSPGGTVITNNSTADITLVGGQGTTGGLYIGSGATSALTANITSGNATISADGVSTLTGKGNLIGASGSSVNLTVVTGNQNDTIVASAGTVVATTGGGANLIGTVGDDNTAAMTITAGAGGLTANDTVVGAGDSTLVITVSAGASMTTGDINTDGSVSNARISLFAAAGSGLIQVYGGDPWNNRGDGSISVNAAANSAIGNVFVGGAAGGNAVTTGSGSAVVTTTSNDTVFGYGNDTINAGRGNETLNFANNAGNDTIYGWTGSGGGTNAITASQGTDSFWFTNQAAQSTTNDVISGFTANDALVLAGYGTSYTPAVATTGGNTTISLSDGTQITVLNYTNFRPGQFTTL